MDEVASGGDSVSKAPHGQARRLRSTVDVNERVNRSLRFSAVDSSLSPRAILRAPDSACDAGNPHAVDIVPEVPH